MPWLVILRHVRKKDLIMAASWEELVENYLMPWVRQQVPDSDKLQIVCAALDDVDHKLRVTYAKR